MINIKRLFIFVVNMITTKEVIDKLADFKSRRSGHYGIERIGIFGSIARGQQNENSDVCVKLNNASLITMYSIQAELEDIMKCKVDVVSLGAIMRPLFKKSLEEDAIYIN